MLWHKTIGAGGISKGLEVTTCVNVNNGSTSTPSVSLTSYDIEAGDIILTSITSKSTSDFSYTCTSTGFIELTELYANDTHDSNMAVYYKVADGAETTLAFSSSTFLHRISVVVVRGADTTVPLDATITTATGINGTAETQPDITTVTDEAGIILFCCASGTGANPLVAFTQPTGTDNFAQAGGSTHRGAAATYIAGDAGSQATPDFGGGTTGDTTQTWICSTVAIRPLVDGRAVEYSGIHDSVTSSGGTLDIPAIADNQMVVFMERANSATPPATRSGFTSAVTASVSAASRSMRLSYRVGGSAESISVSNNAGFAIFNYATTIGQTAAYEVNSASTSVPISAISSLDTSGNSTLFAMPYVPTLVDAVASPYTVEVDLGAYIEENTSASIAQTNFTTSLFTGLFHVTCVMEIKN